MNFSDTGGRNSFGINGIESTEQQISALKMNKNLNKILKQIIYLW